MCTIVSTTYAYVYYHTRYIYQDSSLMKMSEQSLFFYFFFLLMAFLKSESKRFKDSKKKAQF